MQAIASKKTLDKTEKYRKIARLLIKICLVYVVASVLVFLVLFIPLLTDKELDNNIVVLGLSTFIDIEGKNGPIFLERQFNLADDYFASTVYFPGSFNPSLIAKADTSSNIVDTIFYVGLFLDATIESILIILLLLRANEVLQNWSKKRPFFREQNKKDIKFIGYGTLILLLIRELFWFLLRLVTGLHLDLLAILNDIAVLFILFAGYICFKSTYEKKLNHIEKY